jgi:uncharacterized lipoprotein YbaY
MRSIRPESAIALRPRLSIVGAVRTTTVLFALAALLGVGGACRRPDLQADERVAAEIAGAWVRPARDGDGVEGFDLLPRGRLAVLNAPGMNGVAWVVNHGELVVSTTNEHSPEPATSRLRIEREGDALKLESYEADYFAGEYRRARAVHVAGVVTYLERAALPPDAKVELALARGGDLVTTATFPARGPVPLAFELSYLPDEPPVVLRLAASIDAGGRALFVTHESVAVPEGKDVTELEVVLSPAPDKIGP